MERNQWTKRGGLAEDLAERLAKREYQNKHRVSPMTTDDKDQRQAFLDPVLKIECDFVVHVKGSDIIPTSPALTTLLSILSFKSLDASTSTHLSAMPDPHIDQRPTSSLPAMAANKINGHGPARATPTLAHDSVARCCPNYPAYETR